VSAHHHYSLSREQNFHLGHLIFHTFLNSSESSSYNLPMPSRDRALILSGLCAFLFAAAVPAQEPPTPEAARILLLPRRIVSGERATLAVLDVSGRLTPGVTVNFSNGDRLTTDKTGRALFVSPLNPGVIFGTIAGRPGRVGTSILSPADAQLSKVEVNAVPRIASLSDRFDILGHGFCGDADTNTVTIGGHAALVLAASPTSLVVLPPDDLEPGIAPVQIVCGRNTFPTFSMIFLRLELHADASPLAAGQHRKLTVTVSGTTARISLDATNLAPDIAELVGGTTVRHSSSGGPENSAHFEVVGRRHGRFLISIRLTPITAHPAP
jgi:hypothetical protein